VIVLINSSEFSGVITTLSISRISSKTLETLSLLLLLIKKISNSFFRVAFSKSSGAGLVQQIFPFSFNALNIINSLTFLKTHVSSRRIYILNDLFPFCLSIWVTSSDCKG
jgi:hypothetical protein